MGTEISAWIIAAWSWLRDNDLPNWVALAFTAILWPLTLFFWQRRRVQSVPGLEVHFVPGTIAIGTTQHSAVDIRFTNHTGSVTYISGARIRNCSSAFRVPIDAARDVAGNSYHLKFISPSGMFDLREVTLQTTKSAQTCMPIDTEMPAEFYTHRTTWLARRFWQRTYFILEYTAMVGTARYAVATYY
jgi:hypothetical protein